MPKLILDLCAGSGAWSEPYVKAGYRVVRVDLPQDVRMLEYDFTRRVHGILAAPPCTMFARVGARWTRTPAQMLDAMSIVDACLRAVAIYRPVWWALENPIGKLARWLGPPVYKCDPCDFGDPWTKRIWLWGDFAAPMKSLTVKPIYAAHQPPRRRDRTSMMSSSQRAERARTSAAFAQAFMEANP